MLRKAVAYRKFVSGTWKKENRPRPGFAMNELYDLSHRSQLLTPRSWFSNEVLGLDDV